MALNKGISDPQLRGTNIKGTNLKSLRCRIPGSTFTGFNGHCLQLSSEQKVQLSDSLMYNE